MKALSYLLVAGATVLGTACSTTNTGSGSGPTSGSSADASTATTSGTATGASTSGTDASGTGSSSVGPGTDQSSASSVGGTGGASGTDMSAFIGTFATMPDAAFLLTAASSNLLEIQAGQMAAQKATNADVKKFAQMMVDRHTQATQKLQAIATPLGVKPAQTLMPIHQAMVDQLATKSSGKQFDEAYINAMETAHQMDIAMFEVKSKKAETSTVQTFATNTLPMLRSHKTTASDIEKEVD